MNTFVSMTILGLDFMVVSYTIPHRCQYLRSEYYG